MTAIAPAFQSGFARDPYWLTRNPVGYLRAALGARAATAPLPPGPTGRPGLGVLPEFRADSFEYGRELHRLYGDVVRVPMPVYDVVLLNHPDLIAQTTNTPDGAYSMIGPMIWSSAILGEAVPVMEGARFRQRRRLIMPMFGAAHLSAISDAMASTFEKKIDGWARFADSGQQVDLQHEIAKASLAGFVKAMCSYDLSEAEIDRFVADFPQIMIAVAAFYLVAPIPRPVHEPFLALRRIRNWMAARIDERLADPNPPSDLLQVLIEAEENGKPVYDRRDLVLELLILIAGGFETVVAATSWTLALLPTNPVAQQRLWDEVDQLGGRRPVFGDLDRLQWAKACFDEGQRLQGHPYMPRFAMRDDVVGGYRIRKGTVTAVSAYAVHRDPRWWGPDADAFDPMRFYDKTLVAQRPNLAFLPFGAGHHRCVGSAMGYMNGQYLLALIHQRFRVHLLPGWEPKHKLSFSVTLDGGLPVTLTRAPKPALGGVSPSDAAPVVAGGCPIHIAK